MLSNPISKCRNLELSLITFRHKLISRSGKRYEPMFILWNHVDGIQKDGVIRIDLNSK